MVFRLDRSRWVVFGAILLSAVFLAAPAGAAQEGPTITGRVSGSPAAGGTLTIEADAIQVGGWQGLDTIDVDLVVAGGVKDRLSFDIGNNLVTVNTQDLVVGTGARASGTYLQLGGDGVTVTTGGAHLILRLRTTVVRAIPASARFRLTATDDFGQSASVARAIAKPASTGGFSWGEMAAFVAIALFAGGFLGNLVASKRRPPARPSVYAAIQRRMQEERPQEPSSP
ncbi:MAG TPA: hypothetical protein VF984_02235 [Actinomycetota bacterium]